MEYELKYNGKLFPEWMCSANYTSVRQGRYLDVIFNCPHELGEMTGHSLQRAMTKISAALRVKQTMKERTEGSVAGLGRGMISLWLPR